MKYKSKKKYSLGVQKVDVPSKGGAGDVAGEALTMAGTGASVGSAFGPWGTVIGTGVGAVTGTVLGGVKAHNANIANKTATRVNKYADTVNAIPEDSKLQSGQVYANGTMDMEATKPVEVEKNELVFKKAGNRYILKADFKGGATHAQGGEDYIAKEGDIIFPGKDRAKVMNKYKTGDHLGLESMRLKLPKDKPSPKYPEGVDAIQPAYQSPNPLNSILSTGLGGGGYTPNTYNQPDAHVSMTGTDDQGGLPFAGAKEASIAPNASPNKYGVTNMRIGSGEEPSINTGGKAAAGVGAAVSAAPILYNAIRGATKPVLSNRRYFNPTKYQYQDISDPNRRAANESYAIDKNNVKQTRGARGQQISELQQASANRYNHLSDINNFEGGRKMDTYNQNVGLQNQANQTNLGLAIQYDNQDAQNRARRNDFQAEAVGQASQFAQKNNQTNYMKSRDAKADEMDKQRLNIMKDIYPNYSPEVTYDQQGNPTIKGVKYAKQRKGNRGIRVNKYK